MSKTVVTILGSISPDDLGIVLPHEHLLWDIRCFLNEEPREIWERHKRKQPVSLENRGYVVYHCEAVEDNLYQDDLDIAIYEARKYKMAGGGTICDLTVKNIGRDPEALYQIAIATGLNIIMGSGYYIAKSWNEDEKKLTEEQIKSEIINEFKNGVRNTGLKPGIIGEIGITDINNPLEMKNLHASGLAQFELHCPINIHIPFWEKEGHKILDVLEETGVDLNQVILSHIDARVEDYDYHDSLAKRGAYVEYDSFGHNYMLTGNKFIPGDNERIKSIFEQINRGNIERILISHDICFKIGLTKWGGFGYEHILLNIIPMLIREGLTKEIVNKILVENPKRVLSW